MRPITADIWDFKISVELNVAHRVSRALRGLYRAQLERLKQARLNRIPEAQRIVRRIGALGRVLEKPLTYAQCFARKLAKASKPFLAKVTLKRPPRSPYVDPRLQRDAEQHIWAAARAAYARTD